MISTPRATSRQCHHDQVHRLTCLVAYAFAPSNKASSPEPIFP